MEYPESEFASTTEKNGPHTDVFDEHKLFDKETSGTGITPVGREWLRIALDPFCDEVERCPGFPDPKGGQSLVYPVRRTITVKKPDLLVGLDPLGSWDCHISMTGLLSTHELNKGILLNAKDTPNFQLGSSSSVPKGKIGSVMITSVLTGEPTSVDIDPGKTMVDNRTSVQALSPIIVDPSTGDAENDFLERGRFREIARGIEVVNVTPMLTRGGSVTVYDTQAAPEQYIINPFAGVSNTGAQCHMTRAPPSLVGDAMLYNGARQWNAELGAYQIATFSDLDLKAPQPHHGDFFLSGADVVVGGTSLALAPVLHISPFVAPGDTRTYTIQVSPTSTKGLYFTGLSKETVLVVNLRSLLEVFPTIDQEIAMLAATPSPEYDPVALQMYHKVARAMPPAVPVRENAFGDWFRKVVAKIGMFTPKVLRITKKAMMAAMPQLRPLDKLIDKGIGRVDFRMKEFDQENKRRAVKKKRKKARKKPKKRR